MIEFVKKPWGHEEIWAHTDRYVAKMLYINKGHRLSLQYHNKKTETIRVMEGTLTLVTQDAAGKSFEKKLLPGNVYHIAPKMIHRFCAVDNDVVLSEVSTTEIDDVVRLEDDYKRKED